MPKGVPIRGDKRMRLKQEVLLLRSSGFTYRTIGDKLKINHEIARQLLWEYLKERSEEQQPELAAQRLLAIERCEEAIEMLVKRIDFHSSKKKLTVEIEELLIKYEDRKLKREQELNALLGTYAPKRTEEEHKKVREFTSEASRKATFDAMKEKYPKKTH
jgi:orotate phosphoribosyltransferase-like protein